MKLSVLSVALLSLSVAVGISEAHLNLVPVAVAPSLWPYCVGSLPCGDLDHDSDCEILGNGGPLGDTLDILEFHGNSWRMLRQELRDPNVPAAIGDGDGDGGMDLISAGVIWEALRPDTFPSESVWSFDPGEVGWPYAQFTDLDSDGRLEATFEGNCGNGVRVFENRGDNQYEEVPFPVLNANGTFAVGDFCCDGHQQLVCGGDGNLYAVECTGPDQYALLCTTRVAGEYENYRFASANDMDHNGLPEFLYVSRSNGGICNLDVYEEPQHGVFDCVWKASYPTNPGYKTVAAGDLDGDLVDEIALSTGLDVRVIKCTGIHQYEEEWMCPKAGAGVMRVFDVNGDGRNELTFATPDSTYIYEDTDGLALDEFARLPKSQVVNMPATIVRAGTCASFPNLNRNAVVAIYDIRGRMITEHRSTAAEAWRWDLTDRHGRRVPAGTYFVLVRCQGQTASTKLCVVD